MSHSSGYVWVWNGEMWLVRYLQVEGQVLAFYARAPHLHVEGQHSRRGPVGTLKLITGCSVRVGSSPYPGIEFRPFTISLPQAQQGMGTALFNFGRGSYSRHCRLGASTGEDAEMWAAGSLLQRSSVFWFTKQLCVV